MLNLTLQESLIQSWNSLPKIHKVHERFVNFSRDAAALRH